MQVALAHPHLQGIGYDLNSLAVHCPFLKRMPNSGGLSGRVRFQAGDFLNDPLPSAEVLIMGHILHDWDLEQKRMLIKKAFERLAGGRRSLHHL